MPVKIKKSDAMNSLSITPLVDIVFLLLIFFLVASRFAEEDQELDVLLPSVSEARPLIAQPSEIFINIDSQGNYFMGGQLLDLGGMEQVLSTAAVNNPLHQSVIIRADRRCSWDAVAQAVSTCHSAGIHDIRPTTAPDN